MNLNSFIAETTAKLIEDKDALVMGQCLSAVGWVAGTIPSWSPKKNLIELSMADVANGGIAVGAALNLDKPVIYIVRYQGFLWYNAISIVNYAAKSYELFQKECPLLVRAIGMEGSIGPVAGNTHHSLFLRMPGINVFAPMTKEEWKYSWDYHYNQNKIPTILSEHRLSYNLEENLRDYSSISSKLTILSISSARIETNKARNILQNQGIEVDQFGLFELAPLKWPEGLIESILKTNNLLIVDSDYTDLNYAEALAYKLFMISGVNASVLGLKKKSAGFSPITDNLPPKAADIVDYVIQKINF